MILLELSDKRCRFIPLKSLVILLQAITSVRRKEHTETAEGSDVKAAHERWSRSLIYHACIQSGVKQSKFVCIYASLDQYAKDAR